MKTRGRLNKHEVRLVSIETHYSNMEATMKFLEVQFGQLASSINAQQKGNFSSDTKNQEHYKAITLKIVKKVKGSKGPRRTC